MSYRQQGYRPPTGQAYQPHGSTLKQGYHPGQKKSNAVVKGDPSFPQYRTPMNSQRSGAPKRRRHRSLRLFFLLLLFAVFATAGIMGYIVYDEVGTAERNNTFYPGVYVNDIPLEGVSYTEAYNYFLQNAQNNLSSWSIELRFGPDSNWAITADTLGMNESLTAVIENAVNEAYMVGRGGNVLERYQTITKLKEDPYHGYTGDIEKNTSRIDGIISEIQSAVYIEAQNASSVFDFSRYNPLVVTPEVNGRELDVAALKTQITKMVSSMQPGIIEVPTKDVLPTVTAASLENEIVRLGNFSSPIAKNSTPERNKNIQRGVDALHGKVVKPGEEISFNKVVGKRTVSNGFFEALEIVSGEFEMGVGGGICQVSSTLYNAVIQANLEVGSRTNHMIPVSYVEMGADATVSDRGIDFKFRNNTGADIYIVARLETSDNGKTKSCLFQIYGRPEPNRYSYSLRHEIVERIPIPSATRIPDYKGEYVHYRDQTREVSKGSIGYKVRTYLVTKDASGNIVDDMPIYVDTYQPQAPKVYVGVTKRD